MKIVVMPSGYDPTTQRHTPRARGGLAEFARANWWMFALVAVLVITAPYIMPSKASNTTAAPVVAPTPTPTAAPGCWYLNSIFVEELKAVYVGEVWVHCQNGTIITLGAETPQTTQSTPAP